MRFEVTQVGEGKSSMFGLTVNEEYVLSNEDLETIKKTINKYLDVRFN